MKGNFNTIFLLYLGLHEFKFLFQLKQDKRLKILWI